MKVDVLAVMDAAYAALDVVYSQDDLRKDLGEARAAVAELIELRDRLEDMAREWTERAEKEVSEAKDNRWAEWVRDRNMVTAATLSYCVYGLRLALDDDIRMRPSGRMAPSTRGEP